VIFLSDIEEFSRIFKTERYLEIGAGVNLNQLLDLGPDILPELLLQCLRRIGSHPVRNMATVGGNLGVRDKRMDLSYPLGLLDTKIEIRSIVHPAVAHWVSWNQLVGEYQQEKKGPAVLISRIRLPENEWNIHFYRKTSYKEPSGSDRRTVFCGLARLFKDTLEEIRFLCGSELSGSFRDKNLESALSGRRIPLPRKEKESILAAMKKKLDDNDFERDTFLSLMEEFLDTIQEYFYNSSGL
jgi:CO/xanthine dehydrogenase FAD-binding subunit